MRYTLRRADKYGEFHASEYEHLAPALKRRDELRDATARWPSSVAIDVIDGDRVDLGVSGIIDWPDTQEDE